MYNERKKSSSALPVKRKSQLPTARTRQDDDEGSLKRLIFSSLAGLAVCSASGGMLITAVCVIAYMSSDPLAMISPFALLALLPSNFFGGLVSAKKFGSSSLVCGLSTAAFQCAASLILSLCMYSIAASGYTLWQGLLLHAASALFCVLGALTGGIKRNPSRKKRRFG